MELYALSTIFFTSFIVGLSGAMIPGPVLAVTITEVARRGVRAGFLLIAGHAILELILVIGFTLGLQTVLKSYIVIHIVGLVGGLFLLWMAYGMLQSIYKGSQFLTEPALQDKSSKFGSLLKGAAVSLSNPYRTLWWATVGAKFVLDSLKYGRTGLSFFYTGHILSDFFWYGVVILTVASGRKFVSGRIYRYVIIVCAIF